MKRDLWITIKGVFPLLLIFLSLGVLSCGPSAPSTSSGDDTVFIQTEKNEIRVRVEIAATPESRAYGLMNRKHLDEYAGMIFLVPPGYRGSFHMKNTYIPLDMIFLDEQGRIFHIEENTTPLTGSGYGPSDGLFAACIEVNGGFVKRHGIKVGDRVSLEFTNPILPR